MTKHWHPEDIKAAVRKKGTSLTELARNKGLAPGSVRNASRNPSRAAELVIAQFLGEPLHELWPDRWSCDGQRLIKSRKAKFSAVATCQQG